MNILAIDTSTEACSAALHIDGNIYTDYRIAPREHSRLILGMIEQLLQQAELSVKALDAVAFGRGPGSFMGLRIAAGVTQGIAFAHDLPVIPVSTLKAIAQRAYEQTKVDNILVAIDARMDEVYWGIYHRRDNCWHIKGEEQVISPDHAKLAELPDSSATDFVAAGNGWKNYRDRLLPGVGQVIHSILDDCLPSADAIARLAGEEYAAGNHLSAADAIPVYLRNNVAKKPAPIKF